MASAAGNVAVKAARQIVKANAGIVVSVGKMQKTVTVRMAKQEWNSKLRKSYTHYHKVLVHDPNGSLIAGDVVTIAQDRYSKNVRHAISEVLAPFGRPMSERPPLMTAEQRQTIYEEKRARKADRRAERKGLLRKDVVQEGEVVDDGSVEIVGTAEGAESKMLEHGREVLPGGLHKYGEVNKELLREKARIQDFHERGLENEEQLEELEKDEARQTDQGKR